METSFPKFLPGNQCIRHFLKGRQDVLIVGGSGLVELRLRGAILRAKLTALEKRASQCSANIPHVCRAGGEGGKLRTDLANESGQSNLGKEIRQTRADV